MRKVLLELVGGPRELRRTDGLVGLLGTLGLGGISSRALGIGLAIFLSDDLLSFLKRSACQGDRIGSHVGDETNPVAVVVHALVQPLGDAHGVASRESELAVRLLLE